MALNGAPHDAQPHPLTVETRSVQAHKGCEQPRRRSRIETDAVITHVHTSSRVVLYPPTLMPPDLLSTVNLIALPIRFANTRWIKSGSAFTWGNSFTSIFGIPFEPCASASCSWRKPLYGRTETLAASRLFAPTGRRKFSSLGHRRFTVAAFAGNGPLSLFRQNVMVSDSSSWRMNAEDAVTLQIQVCCLLSSTLVRHDGSSTAPQHPSTWRADQ